MRIHFPLLSALSTAVLLYACMLGGSPSIDSLSIDVNVSGDEVLLNIHPIIRVDADSESILAATGEKGIWGLAFGNAIIINSDIPSQLSLDLVLEHERNHLKQWRGIGVIKPLVNGFFNMEGQDGNPHTNWWLNAEYCNMTMWTPPDWWPFQWSFLTIELSI